MKLVVEQVTEPTDEVERLIGALVRTLSVHYTLEQQHGLPIAEIFKPNIRFFIARLDGEAVGCGGVALNSDFAEVKRMFVKDEVRGRGVAQAILARLEGEARRANLRWLLLETGDRQEAAMRLYERAGFVKRSAFGHYADMAPERITTSIFYEKDLQS